MANTINDVERDPIDNMYVDLMKKFRALPAGKLLLPKDVLKEVLETYNAYADLEHEENELEENEIQEDE